MRKLLIRFAFPHRALALAGLTVAMLLATSPIHGQEPVPDTVRVEEDWLVEIGDPVPELSGPQVVLVLSPVASTGSELAVFEVNHTTFPKFQPGGIQLQFWKGDVLKDVSTAPQYQVLSVPDETIQFTSRMKVENGYLSFEIRNGQSTTWGTFGASGQLRCSRVSGLANLNGYQTAVSKQNSRVAFGSHRVRRLVLTEVRYYSEVGLIKTDTTDQIVHQHLAQ